MVVRGHPSLSLTRQCRLLSIGRSSLYDRPKGESAETLALMRRIDALFLKYPFYGARQMVRHLRREGVRIGRRRAARLMRLLGLQAVYRAPRTSAPHLGHRVYPYLLRGLAIERPNHVWCADITYIPVRRGFLYLVAIMDWASRCVLAWRLSNTLDAGFCVEALDEALARHGTPQIFNTDQGSQFTGFAFTARLREAGIRISMDGRGRCMDNIFIERLWRSLKYEAVYLHEIADGFAARRVIGQWIGFYNTERPHSALGGRTPAEAYRGDTPVDMMDKPLRALTTYPQAQQQQQKDRSKRILAAQTSTGIHLENAVSLSDKPTPPQGDQRVDQAGKLAGGCVDGNRGILAGEARTVPGADERLAPASVQGRHAKGLRGLVDHLGRAARQGFATTDAGSRRQPEPGTEVLRGREGREVRADLRRDRECGRNPDRRDRGEIDAHHPVQGLGHRLFAGGPLGSIAPDLRRAARGSVVRSRIRRTVRPIVRRRQAVDLRRDLRLADLNLASEKVEALHRLRQCEQMLLAPGALQCCRDPVAAGLDPPVPKFCEPVWITLAVDDRPQDPLSRHAGDVADHRVKPHVHLGQRLLHVQHTARAIFDQPLRLAHIRAQRAYRIAGTEGTSQKPVRQKLTDPLAIKHIALATGDLLRLRWRRKIGQVVKVYSAV